MNNSEKIAYAEERIKQLKILIKHWKNNGKKTFL
tara:strand:+ start:432 stop:533 length:102 start_codon:yes stop_codon:yes gene_type:complete